LQAMLEEPRVCIRFFTLKKIILDSTTLWASPGVVGKGENGGQTEARHQQRRGEKGARPAPEILVKRAGKYLLHLIFIQNHSNLAESH
jgi:hypothetical protein